MRCDQHRRRETCALRRLLRLGYQGTSTLMRYEHAGDLHYINRHGIVMTSLSNEEIKEDRHEATKEYLFTCKPHWNMVWLRGFADHAPINYVSAVMGLRP